MARNARMLVGHCRWATHGDPRNNLNNHPHPADGGWIVHNGVVHNHEDLRRRVRPLAVTECDSEVLGLLIEASTRHAADAMRSDGERGTTEPRDARRLGSPGAG